MADYVAPQQNGGLKHRHASKDFQNFLNNNMNAEKSNVDVDVTRAEFDELDSPTMVQQFYEDSHVFVTGVTGFMGKVLVEKLLRCCPGVKCIYLLVREKKGKNIAERIDEVAASPCFERLRNEMPKFKDKLVSIPGDLGSEMLGISEDDRKMLGEQITHVFHVAATVRFDEVINTAINQNVKGTKDLLNLCRTFTKIKSVIHVSTAYANCPSPVITENFYEPPMDCDAAIELADTCDLSKLKSSTPQLLGKWPNTYAYTKAISENAVKKYSDDLPVGIFRPGIVVCTQHEPVPGWIDNLYGPTGVIIGCASGVLRTLRVGRDIEANVVPCDLAINALIVSAWDVAQNRSSGRVNIPIYNFTTSKVNPITWGNYIDSYLNHGREHPTSKAIWYYYLVMANSTFSYLLQKIFLHYLPGLIMDIGFVCTGHKPQMMRIYSKIHKFTDVVTYFSITQWHFDEGNVPLMWEALASRDRKLFPFNMRDMDWDSYVRDSCSGLRKYLMKDDPSTIVWAKSRMQKLYLLHRTTQFVLISLFIWLAWILINTVLPISSAIQTTRIIPSLV